MSYVVYCHTCTVTGKHYVGKTKTTMESRWRAHVRDSKSKLTYFWKAIQEYGPDAWEHRILAECQTNEEASQLEIEWIAQFNSSDPRFGYNLTKGGEGCTANEETRRKLRNQIWTADSRAKLSMSCKGRRINDDTREQIRQTLTGRTMPDNVRQKISQALKGRSVSEETKRRMSEGKRASWARKKESANV